MPGDDIATAIDRKIVGWTDQTIGEIARSLAHAVGLGDHVVKTIHTVRLGYLDAKVVFDYNPDGKPVALWLETGFKAHDIFGDPLSWIDKDTGNRRFAFHVRHPGFVGYGIMERAWDLGTPILSKLIKDELESDKIKF
jgi:hypothetical protein